MKTTTGDLVAREKKARRFGLSILEASQLLHLYNHTGRIVNLVGGFSMHSPAAFEWCSFEYDGHLINADGFGIITSTFDVLCARPVRAGNGVGSVSIA